jgi:hypothetical protein
MPLLLMSASKVKGKQEISYPKIIVGANGCLSLFLLHLQGYPFPSDKPDKQITKHPALANPSLTKISEILTILFPTPRYSRNQTANIKQNHRNYSVGLYNRC